MASKGMAAAMLLMGLGVAAYGWTGLLWSLLFLFLVTQQEK